MEGKLAAALKHFDSAVKMNPTDHMNWYKRATAHIIEKKFEAALRDLAKVLEIKPDYFQALDKRAKIHTSQGRFQEAREDVQALLKSKDSASLRETLSNLHLAEQAYDAAKTLLEQKNYQAARDHLNKAIDVASDCVQLLLMRAECHLKLGDRENALADTGKALKVDSKHMAALAMRGQAYYEMDELDMAQRHFREGLRLDPEHKVCKQAYRKIKQMENVAKAAQKEMDSKQYNEALESYEKGAKIDPNHVLFTGKMNLGRCQVLIKLKKYREAIEACSEVMNIPEQIHDRMQTLLSRAEALQGLEDWEEAVRDCERALNLQKDSHEAKEKLERAKQLLKKSKMKDYYKVLDVPKDADDRAIKKAYKKKALTMHPDKTKEESDLANRKFHEIAEAHEVLTDPEKRAKYDRGEDPINEQPQGNPGQGFPFGFGGGGGGSHHFTFHFG
ncbi:hypothetical protein GUITHDRAFT_72696 [Guillardia theta CCMP2712]|uniref:J domain-containing protein n=1 Tax=Guillardia theta (strain CCMP2712) TaxID=905079 RepID=L1J7C8_GUITC|nr:hypothetical protein GUITHDRAFT_72696 [Guillardia theta CCMP2712]EKX44009.1 hypothetical protein GUITHDRAFT_72696 [Guillardia theta CCMP2712]|eukprot:XP_005830989.1 hypothetical protein GUITHDRAFT_72696 [Guillardia theta CCMP2712]